ncbi:uncharacterized protein LOC123525906 [Mercenaria mercenaria]|uniref:uncharacterized protein LOC123525906 n=1 Tax=Mercenaria mercenaria TaxID=6596 RepID=UPI00234F0B83|nr:uncharacterized protein LOC123525906 [Mercenaria mercenaria]
MTSSQEIILHLKRGFEHSQWRGSLLKLVPAGEGRWGGGVRGVILAITTDEWIWERNIVVENQEKHIRRLQLELIQERKKRLELEEQINQQTQRNYYLERRMNDQDINIAGQTKLIAELSSRVTSTKVKKLAEETRKRFLVDDIETVAFHATLDQNSGLEHIRVGSTIPFPNVKLNIRGGYQNSSSMFVTPQAGLYIFSTSISSYWNDKGELQVGIMKNRAYQAGAFVDDIGGPPEQGSVTIAMLLEVGDHVWVKHVVHDDCALYGGGLTSFTGCLIFAV